jgi:hypothetical protein
LQPVKAHQSIQKQLSISLQDKEIAMACNSSVSRVDQIMEHYKNLAGHGSPGKQPRLFAALGHEPPRGGFLFGGGVGRCREVETRKMTVEIEMTEEEAERFERYIKKGCYDRAKLLGKWINGTLKRIEENYRIAFSGGN